MMDELINKSKGQLLKQIEELRIQLDEANDTIDAIRTGQIDALVVQGNGGHQLYTLKSADQTYRVFIEKMAEGAVTLDPNGIVLYCNSQFGEIINLSISQIIGTSFERFVADADKQRYKEVFVNGWTEDSKCEVNMLASNKETPVQLSVTTLDLEEGKSLSIIVTDLTAQKITQKLLIEKNIELGEINRALESSNHDLQQFASIASHDLQEPIRKIQIFSSFIEENETEMSPQSKLHLRKVIHSSARMKTLVTEILNYSKLSADENKVMTVDLNVIIADLLEHFELVIKEKHALINVGNLPVIQGNTGQLRQMLQNLISNALKFAREDLLPVIEINSKRIGAKA
ncbi:MAG TPA: PAS domain-containing protein, partial [Flavitalea sp.]|nr:PAS domain-containing protein [Flavitalea sp.]